jgi:hypothetical protein
MRRHQHIPMVNQSVLVFANYVAIETRDELARSRRHESINSVITVALGPSSLQPRLRITFARQCRCRLVHDRPVFTILSFKAPMVHETL